MRLTISRRSLRDALTPTIAKAKAVGLQATDDDRVILLASDGIVATGRPLTDFRVSEPGSIVLPVKILRQIVAKSDAEHLTLADNLDPTANRRAEYQRRRAAAQRWSKPRKQPRGRKKERGAWWSSDTWTPAANVWEDTGRLGTSITVKPTRDAAGISATWHLHTGTSVDKLPALPSVSTDSIQVDSQALDRALARLARFVDASDLPEPENVGLRYCAMHGIRLEVYTDRLTMIATDGRQLGEWTIRRDPPSGFSESGEQVDPKPIKVATIHPAAFKPLADFLADQKTGRGRKATWGRVNLTVGDDGSLVLSDQRGDNLIACKGLGGRFPRHGDVWPTRITERVRLDVARFAEAIKAVGIGLNDPEWNNGVDFKFADGRLTLQSGSDRESLTTVEVPTNLDPNVSLKGFSLGHSYVVNFLRSLDKSVKAIELGYVSPKDAVQFQVWGEPGYRHILMPLTRERDDKDEREVTSDSISRPEPAPVPVPVQTYERPAASVVPPAKRKPGRPRKVRVEPAPAPVESAPPSVAVVAPVNPVPDFSVVSFDCLSPAPVDPPALAFLPSKPTPGPRLPADMPSVTYLVAEQPGPETVSVEMTVYAVRGDVQSESVEPNTREVESEPTEATSGLPDVPAECCSAGEPEPCAACLTVPSEPEETKPADPWTCDHCGKPHSEWGDGWRVNEGNFCGRECFFAVHPAPILPDPEREPAPVVEVNPPVRAFLTLTIGDKPYGLYVLPSPEGPSFIIERGDGESYDVQPGEHGPECGCPDFQHRRKGLDAGGCKHVKALRAVGLLAALPVPILQAAG